MERLNTDPKNEGGGFLTGIARGIEQLALIWGSLNNPENDLSKKGDFKGGKNESPSR